METQAYPGPKSSATTEGRQAPQPGAPPPPAGAAQFQGSNDGDGSEPKNPQWVSQRSPQSQVSPAIVKSGPVTPGRKPLYGS